MSAAIWEEIERAIAKVQDDFREPAGIVFNQGAYHAALYADARGAVDIERRSCMGLPFRIDHAPDAPAVRVIDHEEIIGGVRFTTPLILDPKQTKTDVEVVVIGRALTKAQLCDIIAQWTRHHPGTRFGAALDDAVRNYGRFE